MTTKDLTCPNCGGPVPPSAAPTVSCPSCTQSLALLGGHEVARYTTQARIGPEEAQRVARSFLGGIRCRELLRFTSDIHAPRALLVPFLEIEADVIGWVFGTRTEKDSHGHKKTTRHEMRVQQRHQESIPLFDPGEIGVHRLPVGRRAERTPHVATASSPLEVVPIVRSDVGRRAEARAGFLQQAQSEQKLSQITGAELSVVAEHSRVLLWPLWRVDYHHRGHGYAVFVDGWDGTVAAGRAPGSVLFGPLFFSFIMPVAAVVLITAAAVGLSLGLGGLYASDASEDVGTAIIALALAAASAIGYAGVRLARAGHRSLRYGRQVDGGYGAHPDAGLFATESGAAHRKALAEERREVERDSVIARETQARERQ